MITGVEDEGDIMTEERKEIMFWGNACSNPCIHDEPREPYRKCGRSTAMAHTRLQGRTRRDTGGYIIHLLHVSRNQFDCV